MELLKRFADHGVLACVVRRAYLVAHEQLFCSC